VAIGRKVRVGLGIGCGVILILAMILLGGSIWFAKNMGREFKVVQETEEALIGALGPVDQYVAPVGGLPPAERVEVFLAVRKSGHEWRIRLTEAVAVFEDSHREKEKGGLPQVVRMLRAGSELAPVYAGYWSQRNRMLLEQQMSLGEYIYIYCLAYYSVLGNAPQDGVGVSFSPFHVSDEEAASEAEDDDSQVRVARKAAGRRINDQVLKMLQSVAFAPESDEGPPTLGPEEVAAEIERMTLDPGRSPWADGAPAAMTDAFAPFRGRLVATYAPAANPVECMYDLAEEND